MPADHQTAPARVICTVCGRDFATRAGCLAHYKAQHVSVRPTTGERVDVEAAPTTEFCNEFADAEQRYVCRFRKGHDGPHHPHINRESSVHRAAPPRATTPEPDGVSDAALDVFAEAGKQRLDGGEIVDWQERQRRATLASSPRVDGPAGAMSEERLAELEADFACYVVDGELIVSPAMRAVGELVREVRRLRAAPSPEIGALVDAMELACYRHQAELTLESCVAAKTTRDAILSAFATLTARAAEAERYRFIVESRATVGFNQLLSVPRPIGSRGPWFCATDVETFHANTPDEAIDKARAALRPSGSGDTHPTETNDERVNDL